MKNEQIIRDHGVFRIVLQAMSRPGSIHVLPYHENDGYVVTLLSSLLDNEVSVAAVGDGAADMLELVTRSTGCRSGGVTDADFILVCGGSSCGQLSGLRRGTSDYPESGATVLYLLEEISGEGGTVSLSGPGIRDRVAPNFPELAADELSLIAELNRDFPLGIDAMFLDRNGRMTCIPRSTRIGVT